MNNNCAILFLQCPLQSNATDCGLFVIEFLEQFLIKAPIKDFRSPIDLSDWFDPKIILKKRESIANILKDLILKDKKLLPELPPISFSDDSEDVEIIDNSQPIENESDNNNEAEFNNNNDFNAVNNNKPSEAISQSMSSPLIISSILDSAELSKLENDKQIQFRECLNQISCDIATYPSIKVKHESINKAIEAADSFDGSQEDSLIPSESEDQKEEASENGDNAVSPIVSDVILIDSD